MTVRRQLSGGELGGEYRRECGGSVFEPIPHEQLASLVASYQVMLGRIKEIVATLNTSICPDVLHYFNQGSRGLAGMSWSATDDRLFHVEAAITALRSDYWSQVLQLSDVYETLPQQCQEAWNARLIAWLRPGYRRGERPSEDLPDLDNEAVDSIICNLSRRRPQFLAERVNRIFNGLSSVPLVEQSEAFSSDLVINIQLDKWGRVDYRKTALINELRCIAARFLCASHEPPFKSTYKLLRSLLSSEVVNVEVDGGAFRFTLTDVGIAHMKVGEVVAWRFNAILASVAPVVRETTHLPYKSDTQHN